MFEQSIRKEVLKAINAKLDYVEKQYQEECDIIDSDARSAKLVAKDKAVASILGKIM